MEITDIDNFCENFTEIYSFKEDQQGKKTCKWCRHHMKMKVPKEYRDTLNESLPERIVKKDFGTCKLACKLAIKAGIKEPFIAVVNDGVCSLFKLSILKILFWKERDNGKTS